MGIAAYDYGTTLCHAVAQNVDLSSLANKFGRPEREDFNDMPVHGLIAKAATTVLTGAVGAAAYDLVRKAATRTSVRDSAVVLTSWGLRGTRRAEVTAESARLAVADVVAEAKERIGEESTPPGADSAGHAHQH